MAYPFNSEPVHDRKARTTASSKAEGRLVADVVGYNRRKKKRKKRKYLKNKLKKYD